MGADEAKQRLKAYAAWKTGNMGLMLPNKKKVFDWMSISLIAYIPD